MTAEKIELPPTDILTAPVRLAFPHLFEAAPTMKGDADESKWKFQANVLLPPDVDMKPYISAVLAAMKDKWGQKIQITGRSNPVHLCKGKNLAGYEDGWRYINTKSGFKPDVVDQANRPITAEDKHRIFAGCWVRAHLSAYGWDNQYGKGVSFSLNSLQLVREDERLDGRRSAADTFEPLEDADDAEFEGAAESEGDGGMFD